MIGVQKRWVLEVQETRKSIIGGAYENVKLRQLDFFVTFSLRFLKVSKEALMKYC